MIKYMQKIKLAIFDLTDCEGCEVQFAALRNLDDFKSIGKYFDISNWRLLSDGVSKGPYDVVIIEGSPTTKSEQKLLKQLRENSKYLIALGACAGIGGIPSIIREKDREKLTRYVYGTQYKPKAVDAKPLQYYVKVDYFIPGCPANPHEIKQVLTDLAYGKPLKEKYYSVCFECKAKDNNCLLVNDNKPCLGPVTKGGCGAICPSNGLKCYGCWGLKRDANVPAMIISLKKHGYTKNQIKKIMDIFWQESAEFQKFLK